MPTCVVETEAESPQSARRLCLTCPQWASSSRATKRAQCGGLGAPRKNARRDCRQAQQGDQCGPRRPKGMGQLFNLLRTNKLTIEVITGNGGAALLPLWTG